ncbi:hypothetical protein B0O99DRAFT_683116 [Bisporella sp. PMI_857]|nr:hypothetical protein B0O99DRAFT_683116 [Bisporella sp. PMI_857]
MAYDARGRLQENGYLEANTSYIPPPVAAEPRDSYTSSRRRSPSIPRKSVNMSVPERSDSAAHDVSPELIAAITEKVKKELMEHLKQTSTPVDSQPEVTPPQCSYSSTRSSSTSSPPPAARKVYTPPSPAQPTKPTYPPAPTVESYPSEPLKPQPPSPVEKPSNVRFSDQPQPQSRPAGGPRTFSSLELSTIDQKWGRLFDSNGDPTQRLGQFLRGLANHMIAEFNPKRSIVVTPVKMATYYSNYALEPEVQHYASIFKAQSNEQISRLYQDLGCEYHLVQDATFVPIVPALTPVGFARWMSLHIMAYPDQEAKRLEKAVLDLPIDADGLTEGKVERLPKQISRHLLPEKEDRGPKMLIETVVANFFEDLGSTRRRKASISSPTLSRHSSIAAVPTTNTRQQRPVEIHQAKASPPQSKQIERERNPYSGAPSVPSDVSTSSNEDGNVKIERERQPYTAQPGSGKVYAEGTSLNSGPRLGRTNSTSQRREIPDVRLPSENRHHRTQSNASQTYAGSQRPPRRTNSPPLKSYSNSTPNNLSGYEYGPPPSASAGSNAPQAFTPSSYTPSSTSFPPPPPYGPKGPRDERPRDERYLRDDFRPTATEFNSPRDAERWDRLQERTGEERERSDRNEHRKSVTTDPRDLRSERGQSFSERERHRGAPAEDWYREPPKGRGYEEKRY